MKTPAQRILALPVVKWESALARLKPSDRSQVEDELGAMIQRAALLYAYTGARFLEWGEGRPHKSAAKHAGRMVVKVRRVLGYSYPANTPLASVL